MLLTRGLEFPIEFYMWNAGGVCDLRYYVWEQQQRCDGREQHNYKTIAEHMFEETTQQPPHNVPLAAFELGPKIAATPLEISSQAKRKMMFCQHLIFGIRSLL